MIKEELLVTLPTSCQVLLHVEQNVGFMKKGVGVIISRGERRGGWEKERSIEVPVDRAFCIDCRGRQHQRIDAESVVAGLGSHGDPSGPGRCWNPGGALPEALHRPTRKSKARSHRMRAA